MVLAAVKTYKSLHIVRASISWVSKKLLWRFRLTFAVKTDSGDKVYNKDHCCSVPSTQSALLEKAEEFTQQAAQDLEGSEREALVKKALMKFSKRIEKKNLPEK